MQLRAFASTREAMKSEKQREKDAKPDGKMAEIVAEAQYMNQLDDIEKMRGE